MSAKNDAGWISMSHLRHMVARGESQGIAIDALLQEAGLARGDLTDAGALVPLAAVETMLASLSRRYEDPLLGLNLARDIQPATFGAIGYISQACTTLGDVLDVAVRYNGLLSNIGRVSVTQRPGAVEVNWECLAGGEALRRHAVDYVLGSFAVLAGLLLPPVAPAAPGQRPDVPWLSVNLAHPRPADPARVREYFRFFRCPVHFDKPVSSVVVPAALLKARLRHGDAFLKDMLERHAQNQLRDREQPASLVDDVHRLVEALVLDGVPGKDVVAGQLGMSSRSLHRKLQEAGSSYREILDAVRLGQAQRRLSAGDAPVNAVALDLGFSSHQAFLRWFRNSTGVTPGEYRRQLAAGLAAAGQGDPS